MTNKILKEIGMLKEYQKWLESINRKFKYGEAVRIRSYVERKKGDNLYSASIKRQVKVGTIGKCIDQFESIRYGKIVKVKFPQVDRKWFFFQDDVEKV